MECGTVLMLALDRNLKTPDERTKRHGRPALDGLQFPCLMAPIRPSTGQFSSENTQIDTSRSRDQSTDSNFPLAAHSNFPPNLKFKKIHFLPLDTGNFVQISRPHVAVTWGRNER
jgi:hypothetical protein